MGQAAGRPQLSLIINPVDETDSSSISSNSKFTPYNLPLSFLFLYPTSNSHSKKVKS
jgi:hypothetical protein